MSVQAHILSKNMFQQWSKKSWNPTWFIWYCWWFRNPANQVRLVVYPIIYRDWDTSQVVVWDFWTINSSMVSHGDLDAPWVLDSGETGQSQGPRLHKSTWFFVDSLPYRWRMTRNPAKTSDLILKGRRSTPKTLETHKTYGYWHLQKLCEDGHWSLKVQSTGSTVYPSVFV